MSWARVADRYFSTLANIVGVPVFVFKDGSRVAAFGGSELQRALESQGVSMSEDPDHPSCEFVRIKSHNHTFVLGPFRKGDEPDAGVRAAWQDAPTKPANADVLLRFAVVLASDVRSVSQEMQDRVARQDAVLEFLHSVSPVRSMQQLVERSVQFFVHEFNASNAVLFAFDCKHRFLDSRYVSVYESVERIVLRELEQARIPLYVRDLASDAQTGRVERIDWIPKALAAFPLIENRKLIGALIVYGESSLNVQNASSLVSELSRMIQSASDFEAVKTSAIMDTLTGLHNRSHFVPAVEKIIPRLREQKRPLTVLLFDVDDFKKYNDTQGHPAGDRVLAQIGKVVKTALPEGALSARYGGEEFLIALPEFDSQRGREVAESLREAIARECALTVSVGQMTCLNASANLSELIQEADKALYRAKHLGKNCVVHFVMVDKALGVIDASRS